MEAEPIIIDDRVSRIQEQCKSLDQAFQDQTNLIRAIMDHVLERKFSRRHESLDELQLIILGFLIGKK